MFKIDIDGVQTLGAKLGRVAGIFESPDAKDVYMDGARVLLEEFRATAPVHSGRFRRSAFIARGRPDKPDVLFMIDYGVCPYAHIVEYGSSRHAPHATIRRAVITSGPVVSRVIAEGLRRELQDTSL